MNEDGANTDKIKTNMNYILNHWVYIMRRVDKVSMPCAMEGAISHDIANLFTSVPKAYVENNLKIYINNRQHYLNGAQLTNLFLQSFDTKPNDDNIIDLTDKFVYKSKSTSSDYIQPKFITDISRASHISSL